MLDTNALLWSLEDNARLSRIAKDTLRDPANIVFVSIVSFWEVALKVSRGKLAVDFADAVAHARAQQFAHLPITTEHLAAAIRLEWHHADPFDRLLIAQATVEDACVVTSDRDFNAYSIQLLAL